MTERKSVAEELAIKLERAHIHALRLSVPEDNESALVDDYLDDSERLLIVAGLRLSAAYLARDECVEIPVPIGLARDLSDSRDGFNSALARCEKERG